MIVQKRMRKLLLYCFPMCPTNGPRVARGDIPGNSVGQGSTSISTLTHVWGAYGAPRRYAAGVPPTAVGACDRRPPFENASLCSSNGCLEIGCSAISQLRGAAVQAWAAVRLKAASSAASGWRSRTRRTSHSNHSGRIRWRPTAS